MAKGENIVRERTELTEVHKREKNDPVENYIVAVLFVCFTIRLVRLNSIDTYVRVASR